MKFSFLLLFFFLFLPFQFALSPLEGVDMASIRLIVLLLFFLWLIRSLVRKKLLLPDVPTLFFFASFLFLALSSGLWAEYPLFSLRKAVFLLSFFPLFLVFSAAFKEDPSLSVKMLRMVVLGAFSSAVVGLGFFFAQFLWGVEKTFSFLVATVLPFFLGETFAQSVALHPSLLVNLSGVTVLRASGVFPDPHMFAFYLGMAAPLALSWFLSSVSTKERFFVGSMFGIIVLTDLLSFSRGGYVGLLCGLAYFLFFAWTTKRFSVRRLLYGGITVLVMLVALLSPVGNRFLSSFSSEDGSKRERLRLFEEAFQHIKERPLLGVGLGNYPFSVDPRASYRDPIYVHNLFLDIAVEIGLLGLCSFLGLIGLAVQRAFLFWRQHQNDWFSLGVLSSLWVFGGHALFETPLFSVHVLPLLLLLISVGVSYAYEASRTK